MNKYNEQTFSEKEVKAGLLTEFIQFLTQFSLKLKDSSFEILIKPGGCCTTVVWVESHDEFESSHFELVDADELVTKEMRFPDGHYEYVLPGTEEDTLNDWLNHNPGWELTPYGTWTNGEENEKMKKELFDEKVLCNK